MDFDNSIQRICLWSGPRNVSTALMYAFAQRPDTTVVDEPLYGHYLRVSGADHPGRDKLLATMDCDGRQVIEKLILGPSDSPVRFFKMMAHHLVDLDRSFLDHTINVILTRDPVEVLPTLSVQLGAPALADTGYEIQLWLYEDLTRRGRDIVVLDARELLLDPAGVLEQLCKKLGLNMDPCMLAWPAGARDFDGAWAPWWYHNVHRSTGFEPYRPKTEPFPEQLKPLLALARPLYQKLHSASIKAGR